MGIFGKSLTIALAVGMTGIAQAVHLDPGGRGQALIYPYYTVNNGQQTLLSVTNTSAVAQAVNVGFHERYNGRPTASFRVFLGPFDVWTGTVFNLRDAGRDSDGAAIVTSDTSCTSPFFSETGVALDDRRPYVPFTNVSFADSNSDGGPQDIWRTREGWIEVIALADLIGSLWSAVTHTNNGLPGNCAAVRNLVAGELTLRPSGGLIGTASIINVSQGTILATRAEALGGFTGSVLLTNTTQVFGGLATVNDTAVEGVATARVFDANGRAQTLTFGGGAGRAIDAVSAVLMANQAFNEYMTDQALSAGSDWILTMPTKPYYTDPLLTSSSTEAMPPFDELVSETHPGLSRVLNIGRNLYDRNSGTFEYCPSSCCGGFPGCGSADLLELKTANAVLSFLNVDDGTDIAASSVLGSRLVTNIRPQAGPAGWLALDFDKFGFHRLPASAEGKVLRGLPVIGFWASNLVNNNVSNGVLANYGIAVRHATSVSCVKASDGTACD